MRDHTIPKKYRNGVVVAGFQLEKQSDRSDGKENYIVSLDSPYFFSSMVGGASGK